LAVTIRDPSPLYAADRTSLPCPVRTASSVPVAASHTRAVLSELAVTIRAPSGLNDADWMRSECPLRVATTAPVFASRIVHRFVGSYHPPVITRVRSGLTPA